METLKRTFEFFFSIYYAVVMKFLVSREDELVYVKSPYRGLLDD